MSGAPGGNGTAAPAPATPAPAATDPAPSTAPDWATFTKSLDSLNSQLGGKLDSLVTTVQGAETAAAGRAQAEATERARAAQAATPRPDFEAMTNAELFAHTTSTIMEAIQSKLDEALRPLNQSLTQTQTQINTDVASREVNAMREAHKDFADWKDEMISLSRQHPSLNVRQLYMLAKADNPDKDKLLDARYNPPPAPPRSLWAGMTPSGASGESPDAPKLSNHEAAVQSYHEVAAKYPGILPALRNL